MSAIQDKKKLTAVASKNAPAEKDASENARDKDVPHAQEDPDGLEVEVFENWDDLENDDWDGKRGTNGTTTLGVKGSANGTSTGTGQTVKK